MRGPPSAPSDEIKAHFSTRGIKGNGLLLVSYVSRPRLTLDHCEARARLICRKEETRPKSELFFPAIEGITKRVHDA